MDIKIFANSTDRTNFIAWPTFSKEDILNSQADTCRFDVRKYGGKIWRPAVGDEIVVMDGAEAIFGGVIVTVEERADGLVITYTAECKDWTHYLDRMNVVERFTETTVGEVIQTLVATYAPGFTADAVNCGIEIKSVAFDNLPVSRCLQKLAEKVNYSWYVDYAKDIHFFSRNSEQAPFDLADDNHTYVFSSLRLKNDISQLRNRVMIRGGETRGTARQENITGDGTKKVFPLAHKFAERPTVTIGGVPVTVGVDYLDKDTDFDCLWSFQEKYIRFVNAPTGAGVVSGIPLYPIRVEVQDDISVAQYGVYEFYREKKDIESVEEARQYANAELEAYANKLSEGSFLTYLPGLRAGQIITVQSDLRGVNEQYLIQRVNLSMRTPTDGIWTVEIASLRTVGIIEVLQRLLLNSKKDLTIDDNAVLEKSYRDYQNVGMTEEITLKEPFVDHQDAGITEEVVKDPFGSNISPLIVFAPYIPKATSGAGATWYNDYWAKRIPLKINKNKVAGDLTNFPVYIDLSLLGEEFWASVKDGGADIRITTSDGKTECPREIVSCDTSTKTGEVHALIPAVSVSVDTVIYIYYGNADAENYLATDAYGSQAVWGAYSGVFHLKGNANDSSASNRNGTLFHTTAESGCLDFKGFMPMHSYLNGTAVIPFGKATTYQRVSQSFVLTEAILFRFETFLRKAVNTGNPTGGVKISIQSDTGGSPSGTTIASFDGNWNGTGALPTNRDYLFFTSGALTGLKVGNTYHIVMSSNVSLSDTNYPNIVYDPDGTYGVMKYFNGTDWITVAGTLRFSVGRSGAVDLGSAISLPQQNMAVSTVLKKNDYNYEDIFDYTSSSNGHLEINRQFAANRFAYRSSGGNNVEFNPAGVALGDNNFHWITLVKDTTSVRLYIDGVLKNTVGTDAIGNNLFRYFGQTQQRVNGEYAQSLKGQMKEARFGTAITSERILTDFNNQNYPATFYSVLTAESFDRKREGVFNQCYW